MIGKVTSAAWYSPAATTSLVVSVYPSAESDLMVSMISTAFHRASSAGTVTVRGTSTVPLTASVAIDCGGPVQGRLAGIV